MILTKNIISNQRFKKRAKEGSLLWAPYTVWRLNVLFLNGVQWIGFLVYRLKHFNWSCNFLLRVRGTYLWSRNSRPYLSTTFLLGTLCNNNHINIYLINKIFGIPAVFLRRYLARSLHIILRTVVWVGNIIFAD